MSKLEEKELARAKSVPRSTAKAMSGMKAKPAKKLVSFQASPEMYQKFSYINDQLGLTNTGAINQMIAQYVKEHSDML